MFKLRNLIFAALLVLATPVQGATRITLTGAGPGGAGGAAPNLNSMIGMAFGATGASDVAINYAGLVSGEGAGPYNSAVTSRYTIAPMAGHIKNLHVADPTTISAGMGFSIALYQNGSATPLTCDVLNGTQVCDDTNVAHIVTVAATDRLAYRFCPYNVASCTAGTAVTGTHNMTVSAVFVADQGGDAGNNTPLFSGPQNTNLATAAVGYGGVGSNNPTSTTEATVSSLFTVGGTIQNLCAFAAAAPASGAGWDVKLWHNGVQATGALTVKLDGSATAPANQYTCTNTGTPENIAAGDTISVQICPWGTATCTAGSAPAATTLAWGLKFTPTVTGLQPIFENTLAQSVSTTRYSPISGAGNPGQASQTIDASAQPTVPSGTTNWILANFVAAYSTDPASTATRAVVAQSAPSLGGTYVNSTINCTMGSGSKITYQGVANSNPGCADAGNTLNLPTASSAVVLNNTSASPSPATVTWMKFGATLQAQ